MSTPIERSNLYNCSPFQMVRLMGATDSEFNERKVIVIHVDKDSNTVHVADAETKELIKIDESFDPSITEISVDIDDYESLQVSTHDVVTEKTDSEIVYLDETVYSNLFTFVSEKEHNYEKARMKTDMIFEAIKWFQNRNISVNEESMKKVEFTWNSGIKELAPFYLEFGNQYIPNTPFIYPFLKNTTKEKSNLVDENLTHLFFDTLPLKKQGYEIVRRFVDEVNGEKNEHVRVEAMPYILQYSPEEENFKYKNMYRDSRRVACSSGSGNDRLYYTALSGPNAKETGNKSSNVDTDFTRVIYYPFTRQYKSSLDDNFNVNSYYARTPTLKDVTFDTRYVMPYTDASSYINFPMKPLHFSLSSILKKNNGVSDQSHPKTQIQNWAEYESVYDFINSTDVFERHRHEIKTLPDLERWMSIYSLTSEHKLPESIIKDISTKVQASISKINKMEKQNRAAQQQLFEMTKSYEEVYKSVFFKFMDLIQRHEPYLEINKLLSKASADIRELEKKWAQKGGKMKPRHSLGRYIFGKDVDSTQIYAHLYAHLSRQIVPNSVFEHVYEGNTYRESSSSLENLINSTIFTYDITPTLSANLHSPMYNTNINRGDICNINQFNKIQRSIDSGKLLFQLMNSKSTFAFIAKLKNVLVEYGRERYFHIRRKKKQKNEEEIADEWDKMTEMEQLQYAPSKQFLRKMYETILGPTMTTFQKFPKLLCSKYKIVKLYPSEEELEQDNRTNEPVFADHNLTSGRRLISKIVSNLNSNETDSVDDIFEDLYYEVTMEKSYNIIQSHIREGDYASVINSNVLYTRLGNKWVRQATDVNTILAESQCPFNFEAIKTMDWTILTEHADKLIDENVEKLCLYEENLKECIPYPLFKLFQFLNKMYARFHELANVVSTMEEEYTSIMKTIQDTMDISILSIKPPHREPLTVYTPGEKQLQTKALHSLMRTFVDYPPQSEQFLDACNRYIQFTSSYTDNERNTDTLMYWTFSEEKTCPHWLDMATIFKSRDDDNASFAQKTQKFIQKWPIDAHGYCTNCGESLHQFVDTQVGHTWEEVEEGKTAVASYNPSTVNIPIHIVDKLGIKRCLSLFSQTMGLQIINENELVTQLSNVILPSITFRSYEDTKKELFKSSPKIEGWYKKSQAERVKFAQSADADPTYFHANEVSYVSFLKRQMDSAKPKKQKRIRKFIQIIEWLQNSHASYVQEQRLLVIMAALYIHIALSVPNCKISKRDSMSKVKIPLNTFEDFNQKRFSFVRTICVYVQKMLLTPSSETLQFPSMMTRKIIREKIQTNVKNGGGSISDAAIRVYEKEIKSYIDKIREFGPQISERIRKKQEFVEKMHAIQDSTLHSFRPSHSAGISSSDSAAQQFMYNLQVALNEKPTLSHIFNSNVFPYVMDPSMENPFVQTIMAKSSFLNKKEQSVHHSHHRRIFTPQEEQTQESCDIEPKYTLMSEHDDHYLRSRYSRLIEQFTSTGKRRVYKQMSVSRELLDVPAYVSFVQSNPLATQYHPAIQEGIEYGDGFIFRDLTHYDEPVFKSTTSIPFNQDDFDQKTLAFKQYRMLTMFDAGSGKETKLVQSFEKHLEMMLKQLWADDGVASSLLETMNEDVKDGETKNNDESVAEKIKQHITTIEYYINEECNDTGFSPSLFSELTIDQLEYLLQEVQIIISSSLHGGTWTQSFKDYEPVRKGFGKEGKVKETLETYKTNSHNLHSAESSIINTIKKGYLQRFVSIQREVRKKEPSLSDIENVLVSVSHIYSGKQFHKEYSKREMECIRLLCVYTLIKQIAKVHDLTKVSSVFKTELVELCRQIVEDVIDIHVISDNDINVAQSYIEHKNNSSRMRFLERLKAEDPFLENSHHMFRRFNLGGLDHVKLSDENDEVSDVVGNVMGEMNADETVEEEGYATLLEDEDNLMS